MTDGDGSIEDLPPKIPGIEDEPPWEAKACTGTEVLCVDSAASAGGGGTSAAPYKTIAEAIASAGDGGLIQVAAGTYEENLTISGKRVLLYGGFVSGSDFATRDVQENVTTVRAPTSGTVFEIRNASGTLVDGFRVTGGKGFCTEFGCEGGAFFIESDGVTVAHNEIFGNTVENADTARGGAMAVEGAVVIKANLIRDNNDNRGPAISGKGPLEITDNIIMNHVASGDHGGAIFVASETGEIKIFRNIVRGNEVGRALTYGWGGGVYIHGEQTRFVMGHNLITDNFAATYGCGVFIDNGAKGDMVGDTIVKNRCGEQGGAGLAVDHLDSAENGSVVNVHNATIADNDCPGRGNAIWSEGVGSAVNVFNSVIWNNGSEFWDNEGVAPITVSYSITGNTKAGEGNLSADPRFANPGALDYHLKSTAGRYDPVARNWVTDSQHSPAIDRGNPSAGHENEPQPNGGRLNLGAFGNTPQASKSN